MAKSFPRSRRVGEQIQRTLSELIRRDVRDPRLGSITLTDVRVADDLSHAKVFYSVLGAGVVAGKGDPELTQEILNDAALMLRGRLGRALSLRHAPEIQFVADTLIDEGARLSALINQAVKRDTDLHAASDDHYSSDDDQQDEQNKNSGARNTDKP
jgi:ribosome-binding factor A